MGNKSSIIQSVAESIEKKGYIEEELKNLFLETFPKLSDFGRIFSHLSTDKLPILIQNMEDILPSAFKNSKFPLYEFLCTVKSEPKKVAAYDYFRVNLREVAYQSPFHALEDIRAVMAILPSEKQDDFFFLLKNHLPHLFKTRAHLMQTLQHLTPAQKEELLTLVKTKLIAGEIDGKILPDTDSYAKLYPNEYLLIRSRILDDEEIKYVLSQQSISLEKAAHSIDSHKSFLSNIDMQVLAGFMMVMGSIAVALAVSVLCGGIVGTAIGVGIASAGSTYGLSSMGLFSNKSDNSSRVQPLDGDQDIWVAPST